MRRTLAVLLSVATLTSVAILPSRADTEGAAARSLVCKERKASGKTFRFCSGSVTSFDGVVKLDADVTLPGRGKGPFPLVVMNHGLGGSKTSLESATIAGEGGTFHFNNLWFASRGYAVLNYTARGFHDDECLDHAVQSEDGRDTYATSPACLPQLDHVDYEAADTQYLVGRLVDGTLLSAKGVKVKPKKIGVVGVSYGAGQTWQLTRRSKWLSPKGTPVKVAAAVPVIGWTDLADALMPNGVFHEDMQPPATLEERLAERPGVLKRSYVDAFYFLLENASSTPFSLPGYLQAWYERAKEGPPYEDATSLHFLRSVLENRSALYIDKVGGRTPTLAINGWTDEIFPAMQALQMFSKLKAEDPSYPISVYLGDWGHPKAQSPLSDTKRQAKLANKWLDWYLKGTGRTAPGSWVRSSETLCTAAGAQTDSVIRGNDLADIQGSSLSLSLQIDGVLDTEVRDPHAALLDPVTQNGTRNACRSTDTAVTPGNLAAEIPVPAGATMLGLPTVSLLVEPSADDMYVAFRLWDVVSETQQVLVDRGVFRLGAAGEQSLVTAMNGNHYEFLAGHSIKLELTANDGPTFSFPSTPGTIGISNVQMTVPLQR